MEVGSHLDRRDAGKTCLVLGIPRDLFFAGDSFPITGEQISFFCVVFDFVIHL